MKKVLFALTAFLLISQACFASTITITTPVVPGDYTYGKMYGEGTFSDTYNFTLAQTSNVNFSFSTLSQYLEDQKVAWISSLKVTFDNLLSFTLADYQSKKYPSYFSSVAAGAHTIAIEGAVYSTGSIADSYQAGYKFTGKVSAVPIPAAAWLLGSAVIGMIGLKRRKM